MISHWSDQSQSITPKKTSISTRQIFKNAILDTRVVVNEVVAASKKANPIEATPKKAKLSVKN